MMQQPPQYRVLVCRGTGCVSGGGDAVYRALKDEVKGGAGPLTEAVDNLLKMHRTVMV